MKILPLFLFLFISGKLFSQSSDFILVQKHKQTVASFYKGNDISFTTTSGAAIDAQITAIRNDSIFLAQYIIQQIPSNAGANIIDTVGSYPYEFNYNEIKSINFPGTRHFDFSASGASLFGGGVLLVVASGVVYLADKKDFSPLLLIAGAALGITGYFLSKNSSDGITIGKKYKLVYIDVTSEKTQ